MDVGPDTGEAILCQSGAKLHEAAIASSGRVPQQDDEVGRGEHQEEGHQRALHESDQEVLLTAGFISAILFPSDAVRRRLDPLRCLLLSLHCNLEQ